ncbi:hypothetical protein PybrP1_007893 [[Pythium] brassicae (nom. inval.)]|nr:hypothetical protein PybrP1_007893 [[Pythium] brassicae (nom. inval.)]
MATKTIMFSAVAACPKLDHQHQYNVTSLTTIEPRCKLSSTSAPSPTASTSTTSWSSRLSRSSKASDSGDDTVAMSALSPEAEALKQQLRRKWPRPLYRFSLRAMRRVVVSPVPIPRELADPRARVATVSGSHLPLTLRMHMRQKGLARRRMPHTVDEHVTY